MRTPTGEGIDLRAYLVWSLFLNFEGQHGYSMRFGLFYVEFSGQRRIPKASAHWWRQFIDEILTLDAA